MKNITKVGLSALAGSLVMVSANAVDYSMSGGLQSVYSTQDNPTGADTTNGKGLTTQTDLSFNASGELDNGFTVGYFMFVDTDAERFKYFISTNSWNGFTWNTSSKQQSWIKS